MKHKSAKSSRLAEFPMSRQEARAVSSALDFVICSDSYTSVDSAFCHEDAFNAAEKNDANISTFSRKELRAITVAIGYSLQHMNDTAEFISHVENDFPGIIADLKESAPIYELLKVRLSAVSAKLAHQK